MTTEREKPPRRRRWLRVLLRIFAGLILLLVVAVAALFLALAHLDAGPIKSWIVERARREGIELDYDEASITWGGLHLRGVRVLSPRVDRDRAPNLVSIDHIDGRWSLFSRRVDELTVGGVALALVVDEAGVTSLDRLLAELPPSAPGPRVPLSQRVESLLPDLTVTSAKLDGVTVTVARRGQDDLTLEGVSVSAALENRHATLRLGPTDLRFTEGTHAARLRVDGKLELEGGRLTTALDLALVEQTLRPEWPEVHALAKLASRIDFLPGEKRTHVELSTLELADGAVRVAFEADLHDTSNAAIHPIVAAATARIDLVALAHLLPKEAGPLLIDAEPLLVTATGLELEPVPRGAVTAAGRIAHLAWRDIELRDLLLELSSRPVGTGLWPLVVHGQAAVAALRLPGQSVTDAKLEFDGTVHGPAGGDLNFTLELAEAVAAASVNRLHLEGQLRDAILAPVPLESTGTLALRGRVGAVHHGAQNLRALVFAFEGRLAGRAPASARLTLDADAVDGTGLPAGPAHLELDATRLALARDDLAQSSGAVNLLARFAGGEVAGTVVGSAADLTWKLDATADRIGPARGLVVATHGRYDGTLDHETRLDVGRVVAGAAALRGAHVQLVSKGTLRRHDGKLGVVLDGVTVRGQAIGSPHFDLTAAVDLERATLDARLLGTAPKSDLHLTAQLEGGHTLRWKAAGELGRIGPTAALLPRGVEWDRMTATLRSQGALRGVVRMGAGGVPLLLPDAADRARGTAEVELTLHELHYRGFDATVADLAAVTLHARAELDTVRRGTLRVDIPEVAGLASGVNVAAAGLSLESEGVFAHGGGGRVTMTARAQSLQQSALPSYPVRDATMAVRLEGDPSSVLAMEVHLDNPGAGSSAQITGQLDRRVVPAADAVPGRKSLVLEGKLEQRLDAVNAAPELLRAGGRISVPFRIESGDLTLFRTSARVALDGVRLELPQHRILITEANGDVPIVQEFVRAPSGVVRVGDGESGIYSQLRFSDHQPFLRDGDFLSVRAVRIGERQFGPLAGNLRIDRDVVALDQLELEALGGKIAGQFLVHLAGRETTASFRGKLTGIRPSEGNDRLDANAALTLAPYRLLLDGRIEIVRLGTQHLYDILNLIDPYHADIAANRVRLGLKIGYPKQVRIALLHGFASLAVELGGLAGLVRIDELRGIALGPLLSHYLAPILEKKP